MPRYAYAGSDTCSVEDLSIRFINPDGRFWSGTFESARGGHIEIMSWPEAESVVFVAVNALYIIDWSDPAIFCGFAAQTRINNVMFDEQGRRLFVAESRAVHAYDCNRNLLWISNVLDGFDDTTLMNCEDSVLTISVKEETGLPRWSIQLREKDGTACLRPRSNSCSDSREVDSRVSPVTSFPASKAFFPDGIFARRRGVTSRIPGRG